MSRLLQDVQYALRLLLKSPTSTIVILAMLTLGIGANTGVFTVFDAVLLRPLPYENPEQLVQLWESRKEGSFRQMDFSYPDFLDVKRLNKSFSAVGGYGIDNVTLSSRDGAEQIPVGVATSGFFETLGVRLPLGRTFVPAEDQQTKTLSVILSYGAWQRRFGGSADLIGRALVMNGNPATVIGVLPRNFAFAPAQSPDLWISAHADGWHLRRNAHWLFPVARLKPGSSVNQAQTELVTLLRQLEMQYSDSNEGLSGRLNDFRREIVGDMQPVLIVVMAAIGFVLLITCANVAGLLLARSVPRRKEISIRVALGARSFHIARQLLTESIFLAVIGGVLGVACAYVAVPTIVRLLPGQFLLSMPPLQELSVNINALCFALALSLFTGILFGVTPVIQSLKPGLQGELQQTSRISVGSSNLLGNVLVISETALAVVLLVGGGLMLRSLNRVMSTDPGFDAHNLLTGSVVLPEKKYSDGPKQLAFQREFFLRLNSLPAVEASAGVTYVPFTGNGNTSRFDVEGFPKTNGGKEYEANSPTITRNYFSVMRIPLRSGRTFSAQDTEKSTHVVVINQAAADLAFPNQNAVGKRINFTYTNEPFYLTVVGVVGNERVNSLDSAATPIIYDCYDQNPNSYFSFVMRAKGPQASLATALTRVVHEMEPDAAIFRVSTMEEVISASPNMVVRSYPAYLIGAFAVLALVLAAMGLYGLISYGVAQRTREFGLRIALGARPHDLLWMVIRNGVKLSVIGTALGICGGFVTGRLIANLLFGVPPTDIATFAGVCGVLLTTAILSSYIPALRAARLDPMVALRYE